MKATYKRYRCDRCGHVSQQQTNHYGKTWSWGRVNVCPKCPPYAKYPQFGGQTVWTCIEPRPPLLPMLAELHERLQRRGAALESEYRDLSNRSHVRPLSLADKCRKSVVPFLIYFAGVEARQIAARMREFARDFS